MSVTVLGSCRVSGISQRNNLNEEISYLHSTKEMLQTLKYILGKLDIPPPYNQFCFRTGILQQTGIQNNPRFKSDLDASNIVLLEICSRKCYICDGFYLHHLCVDKRFPNYQALTPPEIVANTIVRIQTDQEIEQDILEMQRLLPNKTFIVVSHYDALDNGKPFESRRSLIKLLEQICFKHNILFTNPAFVFANYKQEEVLTNDLGHYTELGISLMTTHLTKVIEHLEAKELAIDM